MVFDISLFVDALQKGGVIFLLVFALFALYKGWWVPGSYYKKAEEREVFWQRIAMEAVPTASKALSIAETKQKE